MELSPVLPATHKGVRKAFALVRLSDALLYSAGKHIEAKAGMDALLTYVRAEAVQLANPARSSSSAAFAPP